MLFLFGIRRTKTAASPLEGCLCPYCNKENTLYAKWESSYFHIFFIPFFPTGKRVEVTCLHCLKKFDGKIMPPKIAATIGQLEAKMNPKRPFWHGCGCFATMVLIAVVIVMAILGWFLTKDMPEEKNQFEDNYKTDIARMTSEPCKRPDDSISCVVKKYLDSAVFEEMNVDKFEYFSKVRDSNVMVVVKISDMKKVEKSVRREIVLLIRSVLANTNDFDDSHIYICIEGKWNTLMVYTPEYKDLDGSYAKEKYMYDFYKTSEVSNQIDSDSIEIIKINTK